MYDLKILRHLNDSHTARKLGLHQVETPFISERTRRSIQSIETGRPLSEITDYIAGGHPSLIEDARSRARCAELAEVLNGPRGYY